MAIKHTVKAGFTLVEIMIVIMIIGLLAAIAVPGFAHARNTSSRTACIANLRQLDGAKNVYLLADSAPSNGKKKKKKKKKPKNYKFLMTDLVPVYIQTEPKCPSGGTYEIGMEGEAPVCDFDNGHEL